MENTQELSQLEVDPNASLPVRVNARIVLRWAAILESWQSGVDRSSASRWVLWEISWPFLLAFSLLYYAYIIVSTPVVYALVYWYVSIPVLVMVDILVTGIVL